MRRCMLFALVLALPITVSAQTKKPEAKPKYPVTAEQVMDRGGAALGPKAAWDKIRTTTMTGRIEIKAQKMKGVVTLKAARPGRFVVRQSIPGFGDTVQAYDGKVGWSKDPIQGLRTIKGAELAALKRAGVFDAHLQWRKLYKKWEMTGIKKVGGRDAYVVKLSPAFGRFTLEYHDTKTFMLVRTDMVTETANGPLPIEVYPTDYRKVDGVLVPFKVRQRMLQSTGPVEVLMTITSVKNNVKIDEREFAKPAK